MKNFATSLLTLILFYLSHLNVCAQTNFVFAYEGFDYLNSLPISMNNGSEQVNTSSVIKYWKNSNGWAGDWVVADKTSGTKINTGYTILNTPNSTDYTAGIKNIVSSGHSAQGGFLGGNVYAGRRLQTSTGGPFANNIDLTPSQGLITKPHPSLTGKIGRDGTTLYLGFLFQKVKYDNDSVFITLHSNPNVYDAYGLGKTISVGYFGPGSGSNKSDFGGKKYWGIRVNDSVYINSTQDSTEIKAGANPSLIVLTITFNSATGNEFSLTVNPPVIGTPVASLGEVLPLPNITVTPFPTGDFSFTSIAYFGGGSAGASTIDEIRFASSFNYASQASEVVSLVSGLCLGSLGDNVYPQGTFGYPGDDEFGAGTAGGPPGSGDTLAVNLPCNAPNDVWWKTTPVYIRKYKSPWKDFTPPNTYNYDSYNSVLCSAQIQDNEYSIVSELRNSRGTDPALNCGGAPVPEWISKYAPSGKPNDYMMVINSAYKPLILYQQIVPGLCSKIKYEFSLDIINIVHDARISFSNPNGCVLGFDPRCDTLLEPGCQQYSQFINSSLGTNNGAVTDGSTSANNTRYTVAPDLEFLINDVIVYTLPSPIPNDFDWHKIGFTFKTKDLLQSKYDANGKTKGSAGFDPTKPALQLTIRNKAPGGDGNDLAVDNIRFIPCGPSVSFSKSGTACTVKATASLPSDYNNIIWQYVGDTLNITKWAPIPVPITFIDSTTINIILDNINANFHIPPKSYIRAIVGGSGYDITNPKCRIASKGQYVDCITPLPVGLLSFTANKVSDGVSLKWETSYEHNNVKFIIERSGEDQKFVDIGSVDGRGNSTDKTIYYFKDHTPLSGNNYYRLKQVDYDGKTEDSKVITINFSGLISVYPNPADKNLIIYFGDNSPSDSKVNIRFVNALGKVISEQNPTINKNENQIILENLPTSNGVYYLEILYQNSITVKKIVISH